ncbi:transposase, partial [Shewanella surugensis]
IHGLFFHLKAGQTQSLAGARILWNKKVYLAAKRLLDGELLIIATNHFLPDSIEVYLKRWEIETLFECLKGRGFNFEDTRITERERVSKMVAVLSIAYCWAHNMGEWRREQGDGVKTKKHGRLEKSLFRHELDLLQQISIGSCRVIKTINRCLNLLIPRPIQPKKIEL